jgi:hypothetical protein
MIVKSALTLRYVHALAIGQLFILEPIFVERVNFLTPVTVRIPVEKLFVVRIDDLDFFSQFEDIFHRVQPVPRHIIVVCDPLNFFVGKFVFRIPLLRRYLAIADPF